MKLYFVRHGESEANVLRVVSNRGYQHGLTAKGQQQAIDLAHSLCDTGIQHIFASPLMRAVQTATTLAATWGVGLTIADALREYDCGALEGRSDSEAWAMHQRTWQDWWIRQDWTSKPDGGESFLDIQARFVPFVQALTRQDGNLSVALVSHGGVYRSMLPLVLENVDFAFAAEHGIANTAYILAETQDGSLYCRHWCGMMP